MATPDDVLAAVEHVKECTGDPAAWLAGLTPQDITDVVTIFAASPQRLDAVIATIRQQHPDLFDSRTGEMMVPPRTGPAGRRPAGPQPDNPASDRQEGDAANAIRGAEAALAQRAAGGSSGSHRLPVRRVADGSCSTAPTASDTEAAHKGQPPDPGLPLRGLCFDPTADRRHGSED